MPNSLPEYLISQSSLAGKFGKGTGTQYKKPIDITQVNRARGRLAHSHEIKESMPKKFLYLFILAGCLSSCQYKFGFSDQSPYYSTITIPHVQGDLKGELTAEVIKKMSSSGAYRYVNCGSDYTLKITLLDTTEQNIDYRYDRKKTGKLKKNIVPTESRFISRVEVTLINTGTGKIVKGPACISASAEFDHTYYTTRDKINVFSLGQLNDIDVARDAAKTPLNRELAERIVDYVVNSW